MSDYGIAVFSFNIANIIIDEEDLSRLTRAFTQTKSEEKLVCSECGVVLQEDAKFCFNCGKKVGAGKKCSTCATENPEDSKFCLNCGTKL